MLSLSMALSSYRLCLFLLLLHHLISICFCYLSSHIPTKSYCQFHSLSFKRSNELKEFELDYFEEDDDNDDDNNITETRSKRIPIKKTKREKVSIFSGLTRWENVNRALLAGVFVAGIGAGITVDSAINTNPKDLASRDAIDRNSPNPKLCTTYGSSAMVLDQRIFVTFNPFNVYVTQADTKPGCVLRPANVVSLLQKERKLLSDTEIESCKNGFNTWAYVGDINNKPQLTCVFQSDDAQNEFLSNPKVGLGEDIYDDDKITIDTSNSGKTVKSNSLKK